MIHVFHTPTGWKVCQEYPEKRPHLEGYIIDPTIDPVMAQVKEEQIEQYNQLVALSITNAVDVREEDLYSLGVVCNRQEQHTNRDMLMIMVRQHPYMYEEVESNHVYSLPELEMEIEYEILQSIAYSTNAGKREAIKVTVNEWNDFSGKKWKLAHVFRKKEESDGQTNLEQYHDATGQITREEFDKMEESQEELWQMIQDEMIEDFRWPKDLLELLKSKFHLTRVKAELKGEKK